jgi:biopolymer transport protein TolR
VSLRRPRRSLAQINVVPYIDVMLVLLIIFMVTAPLINPGEIELPSVGQDLSAPEAPLEITIKLDRSIVLRDKAASGDAVKLNRDGLLAAVRAKQDKRPDQAVVIAADKGVKYDDVVGVLDLLQRNRVRKVGLLARPQP